MAMPIRGAFLVARSELRPHTALVLETIALRHQIPVLERNRFARASVLRIGCFGSCCRIGGGAGVKVLLITQPETVLRAA
jgi:hypothetical protein